MDHLPPDVTLVTVTRVPRERGPGMTVGTFTKEMQARLEAAYNEKYPPTHADATALGFERFSAPEHYSDSYDHFRNFFASVRSRQPVVEDPVFGFRAAGAALLSNVSYEQDRIVHWDPERMEMRKV